jgi:hypothetical protein
MSLVVYVMDELGMLTPIVGGISAIVVISVLIYVLKRA